MVTSSVPRIIVGGTAAGAGKSLVVFALLVALHKRGLSVSCCVTGESLHQAILYSHVTRRYSRVLDTRLLDAEQIKSALYQASIGADVVIIDGHGGWLDGTEPYDLAGSDAQLARATATPIVLVHDTCGDPQAAVDSARHAIAQQGAPSVAACIANRLSPVAAGTPCITHPLVEALNQAAQANQLPRCIGGLPETPLAADFLSAGTTQNNTPATVPMQLFIEAGNLAGSGIDVDALLAIAASAPPLRADDPVSEPGRRLCRIAVTDDSCFSLLYPDNLDMLRHAGAEIVPFSPLVDGSLPKRIGGLYVTGAYLQAYGRELSENDNIRRSIKQFADAGGVLYSEGAGSAFLCRTFQFERGGPVFQGAGVIPAEALPAALGRTLVTGQTIDDTVLGFSGLRLRGLSLGDWSIGGLHAGYGRYLVNTMQLLAAGREPVPEGFSASSQSFSTFTFLHFGSCFSVAKTLVEAAQVVERARERSESASPAPR